MGFWFFLSSFCPLLQLKNLTSFHDPKICSVHTRNLPRIHLKFTLAFVVERESDSEAPIPESSWNNSKNSMSNKRDGKLGPECGKPEWKWAVFVVKNPPKNPVAPPPHILLVESRRTETQQLTCCCGQWEEGEGGTDSLVKPPQCYPITLQPEGHQDGATLTVGEQRPPEQLYHLTISLSRHLHCKNGSSHSLAILNTSSS